MSELHKLNEVNTVYIKELEEMLLYFKKQLFGKKSEWTKIWINCPYLKFQTVFLTLTKAHKKVRKRSKNTKKWQKDKRAKKP